MTPFQLAVLSVVAGIPSGITMSYSDVALFSGAPGAARAVGSVLKQNWDPNIPCHRVIKQCGKFGEYNRGAKLKQQKIQQEHRIKLSV